MEDRHRNTEMYGICKDMLLEDIKRLIENLIAFNYISEYTLLNKAKVYAAQHYLELGERSNDILELDIMFRFALTGKRKANKNENLTTSV